LNEPGIWKYSLLSAAGKVNLEHYFAQALEGRKNKVQLPFIVFDKQTQEYAGSTRYYDIQENNQSLQLGYTWYGKKFQGSGLNKRCKFLLLDYAFDTLKMQRVEFRADNNNVRSIAAMKSIGCTVEGILEVIV
jgi:RimJ/RimL family protein N-acetyltransferase